MSAPFKTPIRIEDERFLVDHEHELIGAVESTTPDELAHIVRCVNAHDALVAALRATADVLAKEQATRRSGFRERALIRARAALAAVEAA